MDNLHSSESQHLVEVIDNHLQDFTEDDEEIVFHETETSKVHTDIFWIKPNLEYRPYSILMTCGLSTKPMKIPEDVKYKYVEVVMLLPKEWELENGKWKENKNKWPLDHLRKIAKIPYETNSWIGFGHTIIHDPTNNKCFPNTNFNSSVILSSKTLPDAFTKIKFNDDTIRVYTAIPLYPEELEYKLNNDANALVDKFIESNIEEIVNSNRVNTCK